MAFYSDELIEEVLNSTDIVSLINEYLPLKRRGANFLGLCPFHKEKTPSFTVSPDKQIYKCFGCGEGGSAIQFISKIENLDFKETLEFLAEKNNIDLQKYIVNNGIKTPDNTDQKEELFNIYKASARYFYEALIEQTKSRESNLSKYLIKRKLDSDTIVRFGLGYGSKKDKTLIEHLKSLGYKEKELIISGVVSKTARGTLYESFSSRLIFPIFDTRDRVIGFGGRVLDNSLPKYVNSPENVVYHKGKNLYALNVAKKEKLDSIIITEGYMDTVALQKSGIHNVVASLGTALTEEQAKLIKKYTSTCILSYDQDSAGKAATLRAIDILKGQGLNVKVLMLNHSDVKDPDEYINKYGKEAFKECIGNSVSYVDYKIEMLRAAADLSNFDSKVNFLSKTATILASIENEIERDMYIEEISNKYKIGKSVILAEVNKKLNKTEVKSNNIYDKINKKKSQGMINTKRRQEEYVIALLASKDKIISRKIREIFSDKIFTSSDLKGLFNSIIKLAEREDITKINLITRLENPEDIKLLSEILCIDMSLFDTDKLIEELKLVFKKEMYIKRREEILQRLTDDNVSNDEKKLLDIELSEILRKIATKK